VKIATKKNSRTKLSFPDRCLPAIIAVGSSLATAPAAALELGELTVQSHLGQPLRASIAYALAPSERIADVCVAMRTGPSVSGLPGIGAARITVANGVILLTGDTPVREPMVSAHVVINCPYAANLSREYLLFIDPEAFSDTPVYQQPVVTQQATARAEPIVVAPAAIERPVAAVRPAPVVRDIEVSMQYQVQRGETLSEIAARIQNRPIGLWPAVDAIFEANPSAFTNNDPNNLKAGSWLSIPSFDGSAVVLADVEPTVTDVEPVATVVEVYEPSFAAEVAPAQEAQVVVEADSGAADRSADVDSVKADGVDAGGGAAIFLDDLASSDVTVGDLRPGDIILDTELPGPTTSSTSPNVTTAVIATNRVSDNSGPPSWLNWLAGSVIAIAFALIMFRRRPGGKISTDPEAPLATDQPQRRFSDTQITNIQSTNTKSTEVLEVDYNLADDSPTDQNLVLDANLVMSTGLAESSNSNISGTFRFAKASELDVEVSSESATPVEDSILDSEVMPVDVIDDDYDMSVIIDATKIPQADDTAEHDFKAVQVTTGDESIMTQTLMTQKDSDYHIIEQDYEDELTATQALSLEIEQAAAELTARMKIDNIDEAGDKTSVLPLATVTELDVTAQMPVRNDEISNSDDTSDSEAVTANTIADEDTVEMPVESRKSK